MPLRTPHRSGITTWLVAWALFSVLGGLWALANPVLSVPDESSHAVYAAAAARGQIWAPAIGTETFVVLPADFENVHDVNGCYVFRADLPAGCAQALTDRPGEAEVVTRAGRYPPAYYAYAGLGSLVASGAKAIYAMRLLTVVLVAGFLASATCSVLASRRRAVGLVGLGLATTPMLFYFSGAVNPQAPEIAVAILLWTSGIWLLVRLREEPDLPLDFGNADLRRVLVALVALPLIRPLSLFWMALVVGALMVAFATWSGMRRLLTARPVLVALPFVLVTVGINIFWVLVREAMIAEDLTAFAELPPDEASLISVAKLSEEYDEMIGVFGWLSTPAPGLVYVLFSLLLGGLLMLTALGSRTRQNVVVALVGLGVMVVPVTFEMLSYDTSAFGWQGRYTLPIAVGVPLMLALGGGADRLPAVVSRRLLVTATSGLVIVQALSFMGALDRHVFGIQGFWGVTAPGWEPPLPAWSLVVGALLVSVIGAALANRAVSRRDANDNEPADDADDDHGFNRDEPLGYDPTTAPREVTDPWPVACNRRPDEDHTLAGGRRVR